MSYPGGFKYTKDHQWIEVTEDRGKVGITDYAQQQLGDVVFIDFPDVGRTIKQGESFGTIESVKSVSELYAPMSGEVLEVNTSLKDNPGLVNANPHDAWILTLKISNPAEAAGLLDAAQYAELTK